MMNRVWVLALLLAAPATAESHRSSFGFDIQVPSNWLVLTRDEVRDNADLFSGTALDGVDAGLVRSIQGDIEAGRLEMYFRKETESADFTDNVNVRKNIDDTVLGPEVLKEVCPTLPSALEQAFGRKIALQECELRKRAGVDALYLEFDGAVEGTRSLQYQVPRSPSVKLLITATTKLTTLEAVRAEFESMVASLRFE